MRPRLLRVICFVAFPKIELWPEKIRNRSVKILNSWQGGEGRVSKAGNLRSSRGIQSIFNLLGRTGKIIIFVIVKLRRGLGKDWQGMAVKAKGLKA